MERERIAIDPQWVKSIEIIKRAELLIAQGYEADATLVILTLKNRKWKRMPDALKREFVQAKD